MFHDPTWHILAPLAFLVSAIMIGIGDGLARRERRKQSRVGRPARDDRDWHGCFMRDVKETPRSWR